MLHLVVKNENTPPREPSQSGPSNHLRLVVSRAERGLRNNHAGLAGRLATEWRESFLPTADQLPLGRPQVVRLFDRTARLKVLPLLDEPLISR